jgi:hypothetical protein
VDTPEDRVLSNWIPLVNQLTVMVSGSKLLGGERKSAFAKKLITELTDSVKSGGGRCPNQVRR